MAVTCPAGHTSTSTDYCDTCGAAIEASGAAQAAPPAAAATAGPPTVATTPCPNCGAPASVDDAFCEVCGLDFATGEMPTKPQPAVPPGAAPISTVAVEAAPGTPAVATAPPGAAPMGTAPPGAAPMGTAPPGAASMGTAPPGAAPMGTVEGWVAVVEADRAFFEGNESPEVELPFPDGQAPREVPLKSTEVLIGRRSDSRGIFPDLDLGAPAEDPGVSRRHALLRHRADGSWVVIDQGSTNGTRVSGVKAPVQPGEERLLLNGDQLLLGAWTRITLKRV